MNSQGRNFLKIPVNEGFRVMTFQKKRKRKFKLYSKELETIKIKRKRCWVKILQENALIFEFTTESSHLDLYFAW